MYILLAAVASICCDLPYVCAVGGKCECIFLYFENSMWDDSHVLNKFLCERICVVFAISHLCKKYYEIYKIKLCLIYRMYCVVLIIIKKCFKKSKKSHQSFFYLIQHALVKSDSKDLMCRYNIMLLFK